MIDSGFRVVWFRRTDICETWFNDEEEAIAFVAEAGRTFDPAVGTVAEFADLVFLPKEARRLSHKSLMRVRGLLRRSVLPVLGPKPLRALCTQDLRAYLDAQQELGLSDGSLERHRVVVRRLCAVASEERLAFIAPP